MELVGVETDCERGWAEPTPKTYLQQHWYALYTCANHEKHVAAELHVRSVEHFLPLYSSVRRWKDRRVTLDLPLFPGYVFVSVALRDRLQVLQIPSVVRFVAFNGVPTALPNYEMEILQTGLSQQLAAGPHPFLTAGRRVRMRSGPLAGIRGILLRRRGKTRFVVSVELIMRSMAVEIDEADVEAV
jgi:transcription antitermination factor NusG